MYTKWTSNLRDPDIKERFESTLKSSKPVLDRLTEILKDAEKELNTTELSEAVFKDPNWPFKQAYYNGYKACLGLVTKLIDLDRQETK